MVSLEVDTNVAEDFSQANTNLMQKIAYALWRRPLSVLLPQSLLPQRPGCSCAELPLPLPTRALAHYSQITSTSAEKEIAILHVKRTECILSICISVAYQSLGLGPAIARGGQAYANL